LGVTPAETAFPSASAFPPVSPFQNGQRNRAPPTEGLDRGVPASAILYLAGEAAGQMPGIQFPRLPQLGRWGRHCIGQSYFETRQEPDFDRHDCRAKYESQHWIPALFALKQTLAASLIAAVQYLRRDTAGRRGMTGEVHIPGIASSPRRGSFNRALVRAGTPDPAPLCCRRPPCPGSL